MPVVERDLTNLVLPAAAVDLAPGSELSAFTLVSGPDTQFPGFEWKLEFPFPQAYRILVTGPGRPRPPHDNFNAPADFARFTIVSLSREASSAVFAFPDANKQSQKISGLCNERLQLKLHWAYQVYTEVIDAGSDADGDKWDDEDDGEDTPDEDDKSGSKNNSGDNDRKTETLFSASSGSDASNLEKPIISDLHARPLALTEHGIIRHWTLDRTRLHVGLGEKAAPIDLTGRSFALHASDSAWYDAYRTDPLYKHTPFLISAPRPNDKFEQGITYAIAHASNSIATWDVGAEIDFPSGGWSKRFVQDWGGLEEWVMFGRGVEGVVKTFAEMAGKPMLVGRDWMGYLGSTMLLSDKENAQELLEDWPEQCVQHDIPCSAMHLSSGFTVDENSNDRWVFHMNKKRYPDFKHMMKVYHQAGMKVIPNVKPYILRNHPASDRLIKADGLYYDPITKGPSKQNLWSSGEGESGAGSWVDLSAKETRTWWAEGVQSLVDLGVDGMWDDNSEFFTRDDDLLFKNDFDHSREVTVSGPVKTGLIGRLTGNELMNKVSHDTLLSASPSRRPFVLTRSANVAAFKYACSTWSGDNLTSWHNMRGSQHIQLNSGLSLMQNTGADVGGFCGDRPSAELFVRWVQLGVTHSRFCIHSGSHDTKGNEKLNTPWMYPEVLPIIRQHIKWRYMMLPFINNLMWRSHLNATPQTAPLFYGPFSSDPCLYSDESLEGFNSWMGVGQLLVAPQLEEGAFAQEVYFPQTSQDDHMLYFNLHAPFETYGAGDHRAIATPIDHSALFAREGAVIPIGKPKATVTALSGDPRRHTDGVDAILESEGGQVGVDDWRGVLLFPGQAGVSYSDDWIEDDGISVKPGTYKVKITYVGKDDAVNVTATSQNEGFSPLWKSELHVILPVGDTRKVSGAKRQSWEGRDCWLIKVE